MVPRQWVLVVAAMGLVAAAAVHTEFVAVVSKALVLVVVLMLRRPPAGS